MSLPLIINAVTVLLNFLLDPLLIYGWGPVAGHGVAGAAMATLLTQVLSAIAAMVILTGGKQGIKLKWRGLAPDWPLIGKAFKLGLPSSIELSARSLALSTMVLLVTPYGTQVLAVYGIGVRLLTLIVIPAMGMSMACSALVGQNMGAGRLDLAEKISHLAVAIIFWLLSGVGVLCYFLAPLIVRFFVKGNPAVAEGGIQFIHIGSLFFGFLGMQQVLGGAFKGGGDTGRSMMVSIINGWIIQLPMALVMSRWFGWGYIGIWISSPLSNVLTSGLAWFWYKKGAWKNKKLVMD